MSPLNVNQNPPIVNKSAIEAAAKYHLGSTRTLLFFLYSHLAFTFFHICSFIAISAALFPDSFHCFFISISTDSKSAKAFRCFLESLPDSRLLINLFLSTLSILFYLVGFKLYCCSYTINTHQLFLTPHRLCKKVKVFLNVNCNCLIISNVVN